MIKKFMPGAQIRESCDCCIKFTASVIVCYDCTAKLKETYRLVIEILIGDVSL